MHYKAGNDLSEMIQVYNLLIQPEGSQCQAAMIGTSDKKALWVMSRQLTLEPVALQKMREHLNKCGISTCIISATKRGEPRTS
jgi:lipocalin